MKPLYILILVSFTAIALFSFAGMINQDSSFLRCVFAVTGTAPCGASQKQAADLLHAQIYKNLSLAVLSAFALLILIWAGLGKIRISELAEQGILIETKSPGLDKFEKWLAMVEKRDPLQA